MLIKCPECGKKISDTCDSCIHCGYKLEKHVNEKVTPSSSPEGPDYLFNFVIQFAIFVVFSFIIIAIFKLYSCIVIPVILLLVCRNTKVGKAIIRVLLKISKFVYRLSKRMIKSSSIFITKTAKKMFKHLMKHKKMTVRCATLIFLIAISFPIYYKFLRFGYVFETVPPEPSGVISFKGEKNTWVRFQEGTYAWGKLNGLVKQYNEKKQLISEVTYQKGKKEGKFTVFYPSDGLNERIIRCVYYNKNDKVNGEAVCYYKNGQKQLEFTFVNGLLNGKFADWYENGQKKSEGFYKDNKLEGETIFYHENGQKKLKAFYKNGKKEGEAITYYENGKILSTSSNKNGVLDGPAVEFHRNGKKYKEVTYVNGKANGKGQIYNEKGELEKVVNIHNGSLFGENLFYSPSGKVYKTVIYENGRPSMVKIGEKNIDVFAPELLEQDILLIETKNRKGDDYDFLLYIGYDKSKTHLAEIIKKVRERKKYYYLYDDLASLRFDWTVSKYDKVAYLSGCYCIKNEHLISTHYTDTKDGIASSYLSKKKCTSCDLVASTNKIREDEEAAAKQLAEQKRYYEEKGKTSDLGRSKCKFHVKLRLPHPSSADFSWRTSSEPNDDYTEVVMKGEFEALNHYGSKVPYEYRCVVDVRTEEVLDLSVYAR